MAKLKPVSEALAEMCASIPTLGDEMVPLPNGIGRMLAQDVIAGTHHPLTNMSAMDGFGVRASDTTSGKPLTIIGDSAAGHPFPHPLGAHEAVRIYTGAYAPEGCDAIILQEEVEERDNSIIPPEIVSVGRFLRARGQDFSRDDTLAKAGTLLTARTAALCALGLQSRVSVKKRPHIAILSSGDELVPMGAIPRYGQLINSNALFLRTALSQMGAEVTDLGIIKDEAGALRSALPTPSEFDLIVTTGGASVGKHDHIVSDIMKEDDAELAFWKIAMRPGKPLIFGNIGDVPVIGLPGNPVSVAVCSFVFLRPILGHMMDRDDMGLQTQYAICDSDLPANDHREDYLRALAHNADDGYWHIAPFERQDSAMMHKLSLANALMIRPPEDGPVKAGDRVTMALLPEGL